MAQTSKPKHSKAEALIIIVVFIFSAIVAGFAIVRDAGGEPQDYVISGDTVYIDDAKVYLSASPHTLNMSGWVEFHLISKLYSGDIDVAFGFNNSRVKPLKVEIWNGTGWVSWGISFERVFYDFNGMDRWYLAYNKTVGAGSEYAIRVYLELPFDGLENSGEYFFAVKPSGETLGEAIAADHFYYLDPWWSVNWRYRQKLTFDNSGQTETLSNFTVLVKLDSTKLNFSLCQSAGQDIRFGNYDNTTALKYEIEYWDQASSSAFIWVKVPTITGLSTTDHIWMYYGNAAASDSQSVEDTWNSGYVAVYHLNEATNATNFDSTANNNDGTPQPPATPPPSVSGQVDGSLDLNGVNQSSLASGAGSGINFGTGNFTVAAFIEADTPTSEDIAVSKWTSGFAAGWRLYVKTDINWQVLNGTTSYTADGGVVGTGYRWVTGIKEDAEIRVYLDDTLIDTVATGAINVTNPTINLYIGQRQHGTGLWFDGVIDEVRLSNVSRSADWIAAQYLSITDQFITFSGRQQYSWVVTFDQSGIPSTVYKHILNVNGTDYEVRDLPIDFAGTFEQVCQYEWTNPVIVSLNSEYVLTGILGGISAANGSGFADVCAYV